MMRYASAPDGVRCDAMPGCDAFMREGFRIVDMLRCDMRRADVRKRESARQRRAGGRVVKGQIDKGQVLVEVVTVRA